MVRLYNPYTDGWDYHSLAMGEKGNDAIYLTRFYAIGALNIVRTFMRSTITPFGQLAH
jgi:hypothetical protein